MNTLKKYKWVWIIVGIVLVGGLALFFISRSRNAAATADTEIGETAVLVAIGAPHRGDGAFEAARYIIDRTKEIVPIWKKEITADGAEWKSEA